MRFQFVWLGCGLMLIAMGCGQSQAPAVNDSTPNLAVSPTSAEDSALPVPDPNGQSNLYLIPEKDSPIQVKVGGDQDSFKSAFPRSFTKARSLEDLPEGATKDHWTAMGWALDDASRGVGALLYDGKIAVVMSQFDSVEDGDVKNEVSLYQEKFGTPLQLNGKHVDYWFWPHGSAVLMICAFRNDLNEVNLTTALGDTNVMAKLHMSSQTATDDLRSVERLYGPLGTGKSVVDDPQ